MIRKRFTQVLLAVTLAVAALVFGLLTAESPPVEAASEDFNSFTGAGFSPTPGVGQLDSDVWIVNGFSDGSMAFGDTRTTGDFARGLDDGGVTTGGTYAFTVTIGNRILGVQPTGTDFTPGSLEFRYQNDTGQALTSMDVGYTLWYRNDQGYASYIELQHSDDCATYTAIPSLTFTTPLTASSPITWESLSITTTISGLSIPVSSVFCLRWASDDAGGTGSRDEFGIDDVSVAPTAPTLIELSDFHAAAAGDTIRLLWTTAVEIDNAGFHLYRSPVQAGPYARINPALIAARADPGQGATYEYADQPGAGRFYYLLEDVDNAGIATRHGPVTAAIATTGSRPASQLFLPIITR